jgi:hypothetical protein
MEKLDLPRKTLGKNAALIHGVALVCGGAAAIAYVSGAALEIVGMGTAAWMGFCGWSALLAARSVFSEEQSVLAVAVGSFAYLEVFVFAYLVARV